MIDAKIKLVRTVLSETHSVCHVHIQTAEGTVMIEVTSDRFNALCNYYDLVRPRNVVPAKTKSEEYFR